MKRTLKILSKLLPLLFLISVTSCNIKRHVNKTDYSKVTQDNSQKVVTETIHRKAKDTLTIPAEKFGAKAKLSIRKGKIRIDAIDISQMPKDVKTKVVIENNILKISGVKKAKQIPVNIDETIHRKTVNHANVNTREDKTVKQKDTKTNWTTFYIVGGIVLIIIILGGIVIVLKYFNIW